MSEIFYVKFSNNALKNLKKVPLTIMHKLHSWIEARELEGLNEVRKLPSFHDEALKGKRKPPKALLCPWGENHSNSQN